MPDTKIVIQPSLVAAAGQKLVTDYLSDSEIAMYTNDIPLSRTLQVSDFVEASFPGYARAEFAIIGGPYQVREFSSLWEADDWFLYPEIPAGETYTVYGIFLLKGGQLVAFNRFPEPIILTSITEAVAFQSRVYAETGFTPVTP